MSPRESTPSPVVLRIGRGWLAFVLMAAGWAGARAQPDVLNRVEQIRQLTPEQASLRLPVRLRAVVTWSVARSVFVQDATGGTYFRLGDLPRPRAGDEVEIVGTTVFGVYLPGIDATECTVIRSGPLPPARPLTYDELAAGRHHYERVSIEGVVRSVSALRSVSAEGGSHGVLRLAVGSRVLEAHLWMDELPAEPLVGRRIRLEGLAIGSITQNEHRLVQPFVRVHSIAEIQPLEPARPAEEAPLITGRQLMAHPVREQSGRRVRIGGTVTAMALDREAFVRDDGTAYALRLVEGQTVAVGDEIEAVGFPELEHYHARVADAEVLRRRPGRRPEPVAADPADFLRGRHANDLVRLTVGVTDRFRSERTETLVGRAGERGVLIRLPAGVGPIAVGSTVTVTGISVVERTRSSGFTEFADSVTLHVQTPEDVELLRAAPWWTAERLSLVLVGLSLVAALAGVWIALLRRQVARQTALLRKNIETDAALRERHRLAREFHDTLAQTLTGLRLRLDAIASAPLAGDMGDLLTDSRRLVHRLQAETRNLVTDLRDTPDGTGDLAAALRALVRQSAVPGAKPRVRSEVEWTRGPLPAATAYHLRMVAQEAVTNALRHAGAQEIVVGLTVRDQRLALTVADDGCGFDAARFSAGAVGHFGCAGVRERCARLGAEVTWHSAPGRGTVVEVALPLDRIQPKAPAPLAI